MLGWGLWVRPVLGTIWSVQVVASEANLLSFAVCPETIRYIS
jgi:hypothetical protein